MGKTRHYEQIYTSSPLRRLELPARRGLVVNYFEASPAEFSENSYDEHHLLINLHAGSQHHTHSRDGRTQELALREGDLVLTPAGVKNSWRWYERSKVVVVTIPPASLEQFAETELHARLETDQLRNCVAQPDQQMYGLSRMLLSEGSAQGLGGDLLAQSLVNALLVNLLRAHGRIKIEPELSLPPSFSRQQYQRVLDYIHEHYDQDIRLQEIAAEAGVSQYHFTRLFKAATQQTPHQFLISFRVEQAKKLLLASDLSLAEIALKTGFADQSHFSNAFKERLGLTPRAFRQQA